MAGNLIVGFAPATAGATGTGGPGFAPAGEKAEGPLGLFSALLGLVLPPQSSTAEFPAASDAALETAAAGPLEVPPPLDVEFGLETPTPPAADGEALLTELVDALAAIDQALASGEPIDPALAEELSGTLDALAGLLAIPLPAEPATGPVAAEPAPTAIAPQARKSDPEALLAPAREVVPVLESGSLHSPAPDGTDLPSPSPALAAATAPVTDGDAPAPAAPPVTAEPAVVATAPQPDPSLPATQPADEATTPVPEPAAGIGRLVEKITRFAETLAPHVPGLARRLEALADRLASGEIPPQTLAGLGIDTASTAEEELNAAIEKLLGATSEIKGTPAPQAFAAARLKLSELMALPPRAEAQRPGAAPSVPAPEPSDLAAEEATEPAPPVAFEPPRSEPRAAESPAPGRSGFADTLRAAVAAEVPAEPGSNAKPTIQVAAPAAAAVAGTKAAHAAYQAPVHQLNIPQVAFEVVRHVQAGHSRFQIRLDPPELGRIDVKLDVDQAGNVNARMTVERSETLDLMQRDQRSLERALAQAGLDSSKTNLEFSLRQNPFAREDGGDGRGKGSGFGGGGDRAADLAETPPEVTQTFYRGSASASGVNLFV